MQAIATESTARPRSWAARHPGWLATLITLAVLGGIVCFVLSIFSLLKSSGAYTGALSRVKLAPAVIHSLGEPIKEGLFVTGSVHLSGPSGRAQLAIPLSGPKGKADIYVAASKNLGEWRFDRLIVQIDSTKQRIDISDGQKRPNKAPEPTPGLVTPRALESVYEMKQRNVNRDDARGAPSPVVAHL